MDRDIEALLRFLEQRSAMPFKWGRRRNDCVSFAAAAVRAQTGRNPLGKIRWTTPYGAARVLKAKGGLAKAVSGKLAHIAPAMASRGDVAGVPDKRFGVRLMIVEGATLAGPGERGIERLPRSAMVMAWDAASVGKR